LTAAFAWAVMNLTIVLQQIGHNKYLNSLKGKKSKNGFTNTILTISFLATLCEKIQFFYAFTEARTLSNINFLTSLPSSSIYYYCSNNNLKMPVYL